MRTPIRRSKDFCIWKGCGKPEGAKAPGYAIFLSFKLPRMKKAIIIAISLLPFIACKKNNTDNPSANTRSTAPNIITLNINGQNYTVSGANRSYIANNAAQIPIVEVSFAKEINGSYIIIEASPAQGQTVNFSLDVTANSNATNGLGDFTINAASTITENFSGGESYKLTSGKVNITKNDLTSLEGTIQAIATNSSNSKNITGSFIFKNVNR